MSISEYNITDKNKKIQFYESIIPNLISKDFIKEKFNKYIFENQRILIKNNGNFMDKERAEVVILELNKLLKEILEGGNTNDDIKTK